MAPHRTFIVARAGSPCHDEVLTELEKGISEMGRSVDSHIFTGWEEHGRDAHATFLHVFDLFFFSVPASVFFVYSVAPPGH